MSAEFSAFWLRVSLIFLRHEIFRRESFHFRLCRCHISRAEDDTCRQSGTRYTRLTGISIVISFSAIARPAEASIEMPKDTPPATAISRADWPMKARTAISRIAAIAPPPRRHFLRLRFHFHYWLNIDYRFRMITFIYYNTILAGHFLDTVFHCHHLPALKKQSFISHFQR